MKEETLANLKTKFLALANWEGIAELVDYYEESTDLLKVKRTNKSDVSYSLFSKKNQYKSYQVPKKKKGKFRNIESPNRKLKSIQKVLQICLDLCFTPRNAAHGFVKKRSIVTNASKHVKRNYVFNIDLLDFFTKIDFKRVRGIFQSKPFLFSPQIAKDLANLCCNDIGVLPQGASTSPAISNLICRALDGKLSRLAKIKRIRYTRYVDDM